MLFPNYRQVIGGPECFKDLLLKSFSKAGPELRNVKKGA